MSKNCKVCHESKSLSEYYSAKGCKDGTWHTCKQCTLKKQNAYNNSRKDIRKEQAAKMYAKKKDIILKKNRAWVIANRKKVNEYASKYKSKKSSLDVANKRDKIRREIDVLYKIKKLLRCRIVSAFKSKEFKKNQSSIKLIGGDLNIAKAHIERQFKKGMTWENHGFKTWHIDHIIPLSAAKTIDELHELCHYTNLQPLWAADNVRKSDKIINPIQMKITI